MFRRVTEAVPKFILTALALSVLLFGCSLWFASISRSQKFVFDTLAYCCAVLLLVKAFPRRNVVNVSSVILLMPVVFLELPYAVFSVTRTPASLLCLLAAPIGVWTARVLAYPGPAKFTGRLVMVAFVGWLAWYGYPLGAHFVNYHTFTGRTEEPAPDFILAAQNKRLDNLQLKDKITVLHFWTAGHPDASKKFRLLSKKVSAYSNRPNVAFYAVNLSTCDAGRKYLDEHGYDFNTACADRAMADAFNIGNYPTTLVLYRDSILYRGSVDNIDGTIRRLLKEDDDRED